jgi:hypothetical protein
MSPVMAMADGDLVLRRYIAHAATLVMITVLAAPGVAGSSMATAAAVRLEHWRTTVLIFAT